ncbi:helix-turn-helix transcriptional regulator [Marinilactibacillus sp. Marseille-P9653]|uniref:helix-turn-helix transcriptional regulator n=1 Tax=Marinilactibacillus sp. Marseille-P9653 TaxID=2866583 RepID=UPI001CE458E2|nr:transcriptional regulator [Marinilactibacillus sp. Marseille-P9653]
MFANNVKVYRVATKKNQSEMAKFLGISRQSYSAKETGQRPFNDLEKKKIKELFSELKKDVTIDEIFFRDSSKLFRIK